MLDHIPNEVKIYIRECLENRWNPFRNTIIIVHVDIRGHSDVFSLDLFEQLSRRDTGIKVKQRYIAYGIKAHERGDTLEELKAKVSAQRADDWFEWEKPQMWSTPGHNFSWYTQELGKIVCRPLTEEDDSLRRMFLLPAV